MERRYKRIVVLLVFSILLPTGVLATLSVFAQSREAELILAEMEQNHYAVARAICGRFDVELLSAEERIIRTANLFCPDEVTEEGLEDFFGLLRRRHRLVGEAALVSEEGEIVWPVEPFGVRGVGKTGRRPFVEPTSPEEIEAQKRAVEAKILLDRLGRSGVSDEEVERRTRRIIREVGDKEVVARARLMLAQVLVKRDVAEAKRVLREVFKSSAVVGGVPAALEAMLAFLDAGGEESDDVARRAYELLLDSAAMLKKAKFDALLARLKKHIREGDLRYRSLERRLKALLSRWRMRRVVSDEIVPRIREYLKGVYHTRLRSRHIRRRVGDGGWEVYSYFAVERRLLYKEQRTRFVMVYRLNPEEVRSLLVFVLNRTGPAVEPRLRVKLFGKVAFSDDVGAEQFSVRYEPPNAVVPLLVEVYSAHVVKLRSWLLGRAVFNILLVVFLVVLAGAGVLLVLRGVRREMDLARLQGEFVSSVSHELKTPLTSIMMFAEMLKEGRVRGQERLKRYSEIIAAESQRLFRMITNVLDFARIEGERKQYQMQETDMREVVRRSLAALSYHITSTGFTVETKCPDEPLRVLADPDALEQVTVNLLSNAIKYSRDEKWVGIRLEKRDSFVILEVEDHGIGIPEDEKERVFERFYRTTISRASKSAGTGIGLNLVKTIVEAHNGKVEVESEVDKGSLFRVILPLMEEDSDGASAGSGRRSADTDGAEGQSGDGGV